MKILLVTGLFHPEPNHLKGLGFAKALKARGHEVHVLTGFPSYPGGRIYPGHRLRWTAEEELDGVAITRVALYPSHDGSGIRRAATYSSLALSQALHLPRLRGRPFDVCHVYLGPITLMWPALLCRALWKSRIVADVQDLWPESVTDSGMLRSRVAQRVLDAWCARTYRAADRLIVLSEGYRDALVQRGVPAEKIEVVYNWCDDASSAGADVAAQGILDPHAFNVVYAGNLGKLQGIDTILDAAKLLSRSARAVRFVVIGDGVDGERLRRRVSEEQISNVQMVGRMPMDAVNAVQRRASIVLIHLESTRLTRMAIPSKVQSGLASGTPILIAADGDSAGLVARAGAGVACRPSDARAMAENIQHLLGMDQDRRSELGKRGREFFERELGFARGVERVEAVFQAALGRSDPRPTGAVSAP